MRDTIVCDGWACSDCTQLIANGETSPELSEDKTREYLERVQTACNDLDVTLGMLREQHSCKDSRGNTEPDNGGWCDCESQTFSMTACDVCNSNLGGERNAVTFWRRNNG